MTRLRLVALGLVVGLLCQACSSGAIGIARAADARTNADPAAAAQAGAAINDFGLALLHAASSGDENAVVSPASIVLALAMARAGARGDTAAQMDAVLRSVASDDHADWLNALDAALASRTGTFRDANDKDLPVTLRIANAPFAQRDEQWDQGYLSALATRFGAGVRLADFKNETEAARQAINGWVKDQTEGRIPQLLDQGVLDSLTRLVLVNAIYLKAAWLKPFEESATSPAMFTRLDGSTVDVPTMHLGEELSYAAGDGWQAVELPYVGGSLALTIIVPEALELFEPTLDGDVLASIVDALRAQHVELALPKFGIETKTDLATTLTSMGMPLAFDPDRADFSGMTSQEQLSISAVIHQANIDLDEKGTTASAATAVVLRASGAPIGVVNLNVDRPFLFALRDVPTGAVLFLGRVVEPRIRA